MATVVRAAGSTYRRPGARMLISEDGESFGVVSGGCLEQDVARQAAQVMRTGAPLLVSYDTRAMLGCNGVVEIFVEALPDGQSFLATAADHLLQRREAFVGATIFETRDGSASALGHLSAPAIRRACSRSLCTGIRGGAFGKPRIASNPRDGRRRNNRLGPCFPASHPPADHRQRVRYRPCGLVRASPRMASNRRQPSCPGCAGTSAGLQLLRGYGRRNAGAGF